MKNLNNNNTESLKEILRLYDPIEKLRNETLTDKEYLEWVNR